MQDLYVTFPGGKRVDAHVGDLVVHTDQPMDAGGEATAVAPFDLFLASIATCAGLYVLGFCQARGLSTEGVSLRQQVEMNPTTHLPTRISLHLRLPATFPEKYRPAVVRAAESCKVKKTISAGPRVDVVLDLAGVDVAQAS